MNEGNDKVNNCGNGKADLGDEDENGDKAKINVQSSIYNF